MRFRTTLRHGRVGPLAFALFAVAAYGALLLPVLAGRQFDLSVFIVAGDYFVSPDKVAITVIPGSFGYDGQFFYRLALDPFLLDRTAHGITFDEPAKRMARIVFPLFAWIVSLGQARFVPAALLAVNLAGLGAIAASAAWLARTRRLSWWFPVAVVAWPGFLGTLMHDTAEITAAALLMVALACYLSDRLGFYVVLAALAALTRETVMPVLLGLFVAEAIAFATSRAWRRPVLCALPFLPLVIWWETLTLFWHSPAQSAAQDLGWPLAGVLAMLRDNLLHVTVWDADPLRDLLSRSFVIATTLGLITFCGLVATHMPTPRAGENRQRRTGLALGWLLTAALMSLLTQRGPWIEPHAYLRAFTECWVAGCLLLALAPAPRMLAGIGTAALATMPVYWLWCVGILP